MRQSISEPSPVDEKRGSCMRRLGSGLVTGAADDDPSGIGTYSQAGPRAVVRAGAAGARWRTAPHAPRLNDARIPQPGDFFRI